MTIIVTHNIVLDSGEGLTLVHKDSHEHGVFLNGQLIPGFSTIRALLDEIILPVIKSLGLEIVEEWGGAGDNGQPATTKLTKPDLGLKIKHYDKPTAGDRFMTPWCNPGDRVSTPKGNGTVQRAKTYEMWVLQDVDLKVHHWDHRDVGRPKESAG